MSSTLIIADIHLTGSQPDNNLFIQFCQQHASKADKLFILGDLFNAWLGDDLSIQTYSQVINALKKLSKTTQIFVMLGNRDFLLSRDFEEKSGAKLLPEHYLFKQNNQQYLLMHGDELCTDDVYYQRLKKILRQPIIQFIFLHLPKNWRLRLGGQLRQKSVEMQRYKSQKIMDVNQSSVDKLMQKYPKTHLIHGHTHRQNTHINATYTRYVLGDWSPTKGNAIQIDTALNWLEIH